MLLPLPDLCPIGLTPTLSEGTGENGQLQYGDHKRAMFEAWYRF